VVIAVIALLTAILLPALGRVRRQAKAVVCRSNVRQWAVAFSAYTNDNNYCFNTGLYGPTATTSKGWPDALRSYTGGNQDLCYCPMATKLVSEGGQHPFAAFCNFVFVPGPSWEEEGWDSGSYGMNAWVYNPPSAVTENRFGLPTANNWRRANVRGASNIPLLLDSMWIDAWPDTTNEPPPFDGDFEGAWHGSRQIRMFCINRHEGTVNGAFVDFSVRKIGLKELWKLKWHRNCDLNAATPEWPVWMKKFKDY